MKTKTKKILCIFLVLLTLFNFTFLNNSYAADGEEEEDGITAGDILEGAIDGVAGILLTPAKLLLFAAGYISNMVASEISEVGATKAESVVSLTLDDIFFHNVEGKIPILDVNFFKARSGDDIIAKIRTNIAGWYYAIRNLAIIISLLVLVYVGIRMAISTLAEDKAKYKKMLTDWIVGFVTIFLLHYIIIATVNVNEALVNALCPKNSNGELSSYMDNLLTDGLTAIGFVEGMGSAIVYCGMTILTFMFLFTYIKRMLTVAFLIIIAPIITVTYSIDKMGDRKISSIKYLAKRVCV